jgi:hypothetical protein
MWLPFRVFWAVTQLIHLLAFPEWIGRPIGIAVFLAVIAVLQKPSDVRRFLVMCGLEVLHVFVQSPTTACHIYFNAFNNLAIGLVVLRHWVCSADHGTNSPAIFEEITAALRCLLLTLYFFAVFHKLNWGYLNLETSCGTYLVDNLTRSWGLPAVPRSARWLAVGGSLLIEASIPWLLWRPRWRRTGVLLACSFHLLLSLHPHHGDYGSFWGIYSFSAMIFAMLTAFLPDRFIDSLQAWWRTAKHARRFTSLVTRYDWGVTWAASLISIAAIFAVAGIAFGWVKVPYAIVRETLFLAGFGLWAVVAGLFVASIVIAWPASARCSGGLLPRQGSMRWVPLVAVGLVSATCSAPYFGFQTVRCLSMFSNLRTEGGRSNHLLMPVSLQVADYQRDLVQITASSIPGLQYCVDEDLLLPYFELRRQVWSDRSAGTVTFIRGNQQVTVDKRDPDSRLRLPPVHWLAGKFLTFRGVDRVGPCRCRW